MFLVIGLWRLTLRIHDVNDSYREAITASGRPVLHLLWHQRLVLGILKYPFKNAVTMASRSKDGDIIAAFLHFWGFRAARGSSTRGGKEALSVMVEMVRGTTAWVALTTDGPRGPARKSKPGLLKLAQLTNAGIIPTGTSSTRPKFLNSWDRFLLPLPFSRCTVFFGPEVTRREGETDEDFLNRIDEAVDAATLEADRLCGVTNAPRERIRREDPK